MILSVTLFSLLLSAIPALVGAEMCAAWYDASVADSVKQCCTHVSGQWIPISDKEGACLGLNEDSSRCWKECANPIMHDPALLPDHLHAWQCSPCGDVCTVTGGPTLTASATKTPEKSSISPPAAVYTTSPGAQERVEEIK